jgi:hypothetical protein
MDSNQLASIQGAFNITTTEIFHRLLQIDRNIKLELPPVENGIMCARIYRKVWYSPKRKTPADRKRRQMDLP